MYFFQFRVGEGRSTSIATPELNEPETKILAKTIKYFALFDWGQRRWNTLSRSRYEPVLRDGHTDLLTTYMYVYMYMYMKRTSMYT